MSIKFLHLRKTHTLKGGKTIAYEIEGNHVIYSTAVTGKKENYNRKRGAAISDGRLNCGRPASMARNIKMIEVTGNVIEALIEVEGGDYYGTPANVASNG